MTTDYFEGVEIETVDTEVESPVETKKVEKEPETPENDAVEDSDDNADENEQGGEEGSRDEPFPKKAVNAISKRDRKIHKLRKEREELQAQIAALKQAQEKTGEVSDEPPKEEDYETYSEFLEARQEYITKKTLTQSKNDQDKEKLDTLEQQQKQKWFEERDVVIENLDTELRSTYSDYDEVIDANMDKAAAIVQQRPDLYESFLALDNPNKAFYNLAKEGKLDSILQMPSNIAVVEFVQAQYRGNEQPKPEKTVEKPVSGAPKPIRSAKGSSSSQTPLHKLDADSLYDRIMS